METRSDARASAGQRGHAFWVWLDKEFEMLRLYNDFLVQALSHSYECGGWKFHIWEIPSFEEFKRDLPRFTVATQKESAFMDGNGKVAWLDYCNGLGVPDRDGFRSFTYFRGAKIYTIGNVSGKFILVKNMVKPTTNDDETKR